MSSLARSKKLVYLFQGRSVLLFGPGWLGILHVVYTGLKLEILWILLPECWDYRHSLPHPHEEMFFGKHLCRPRRQRLVGIVSPGLPDVWSSSQCYLWDPPILKNDKPTLLTQWTLMDWEPSSRPILHENYQFFPVSPQAILYPFCFVYNLVSCPLNTSKHRPERPHQSPLQNMKWVQISNQTPKHCEFRKLVPIKEKCDYLRKRV